MPEIIHLQLAWDANRHVHGCIAPPSKWVNAYVLTADTPVTVAIPSGAVKAMFSATGHFFVNFAGTAAIPSTSVTDGTASDLNPTTRDLTGYTTFSIIAAETGTIVMVSFYA